jgi:hypothetical protein
MTQLHDEMCESLVVATRDELDIISTVDVQKHGVLAEADSMVWDFDLKSMWLTKSRWSMMCRQYIDPEELQAWINTVTSRIGLKGRGIAVMRTKVVKPRGGAATGHTNKETRRWGSCMLTISYKAKPVPTVALHSRTSYLGYIGALDLSVAWMIARYLAKEMGVDVSTFKFVWYNEAIQWHNFKSLAFLLSNDNDEMRTFYRRLLIKPRSKLTARELEYLNSSPALTLSRKWLRKVMKEDAEGKTYGDMTYNTYRRIRRRWHAEVLGVERAKEFAGWSHYKTGERAGEQKEFFKHYPALPSVLIENLDFSCIGMPLNGKYGEIFVGGGLEDEDDD